MANEKPASEVPLVLIRKPKEDAIAEAEDENMEEFLAELEFLPTTEAPPKDRFYGVLFIMFLHGCAVLTPWTMFINFCYPYFVDYKLSPSYANKTGNWDNPEASDWQKSFCHRMTVCNQIPNMVFTLVNCFVQFGDNSIGIRVVGSLMAMTASFVVMTILAMVDTSEIVRTFIIITLICVVLALAGVGVFQNSVWGIVAPLPMQYTNVFLSGMSFIGILASIFSITTIVTSPDMKVAGIYYFMAGVFILLLTIDSYFALPFSKYYRYYADLKVEECKEECDANHKPTFMENLTEFFNIFKMLWIHYWDVFVTFFVTLFAFPNLVMWIKAGEDENFFIGDQLYAQVLCFLTFNVFQFVGNMIPNWFQYPKPRYLWIFTTSRLLFIPFFMLLNYQHPAGVRRFSPLIENSWVYWIAMIIFSTTHGYCSSLAMMYIPKLAEPQFASKAGMLAGALLVVAINLGVTTSAVVEWIMLK